MRLRQIADKYGIDYNLLYQMLSYKNAIRRYGKYDEYDAIRIFATGVFERIEVHKAKIYKYLDCVENINAVLKKERQKQGK